MVEPDGIEPTTSSMPSKRSAQQRHPAAGGHRALLALQGYVHMDAALVVAADGVTTFAGRPKRRREGGTTFQFHIIFESSVVWSLPPPHSGRSARARPKSPRPAWSRFVAVVYPGRRGQNRPLVETEASADVPVSHFQRRRHSSGAGSHGLTEFSTFLDPHGAPERRVDVEVRGVCLNPPAESQAARVGLHAGQHERG